MELDLVLQGFAQFEQFSAVLRAGPYDTGVSVDYARPDRMLIRNLQGELPSRLLLHGQTAAVGTAAAQVALDPGQQAWEELPRDSGFMIYRMLDPRFVLRYSTIEFEEQPRALVQQAGIRMPLRQFSEAGLLPSMLEELVGFVEDRESVKFLITVDSGRTSSMTVLDFAAEPGPVVLEFEYPPQTN